MPKKSLFGGKIFMVFGEVFQLSPFHSVGDWDGKLSLLGREKTQDKVGKKSTFNSSKLQLPKLNTTNPLAFSKK